MRFVLNRVFLLLFYIFYVQLSYAQQDADSRPKFILKTSLAPLFMYFSTQSSAGLGYEVRLNEHWTLGGAANIRFKSLFGHPDPHKGLSFSQDIRRYKLQTRLNWFLGCSATIAQSVTQMLGHFSDAGTDYNKVVSHEYKSLNMYAVSGIQPQLKSSRFTLDLYGGFGGGFRASRFKNLSPAESAQLKTDMNLGPYDPYSNEKLAGIKTGSGFIFSFYFGLSLGYIINR